MAGPFPLHKLVLSEFQLHQSKWKEELKQIQCNGPEFASHVSNLESVTVFFNRERTLLGKITAPRHPQMRTFTFWQITKQVVGHLKALNLDPITSMLQQLHLQLSQGKKSKAAHIPSFAQAFTLHQLRSTHWICMSACDLMRRGYDQYGSMVIMSHLMPICLAVMSVFSRLTLLLSRVAYFCATAYNSLIEFCHTDPQALPTIAQWDFLVGSIDRSLVVPDNVQWEDLSHKMTSSDKNQKELDKLNLELQRKNDEDDDDLGEELDEVLIYKPVAASKPTPKPISKPVHTPKPAAHAEPKVSEKRSESKQSSDPALHSESKSKDKPKDKLKEKRSHIEPIKESKSGKEVEKTKLKSFDDDDFELLWQAPKDTGSQKKKDKSSHKHKDKSSSRKDDKDGEDSKKRKKAIAAASDEIDDLFGLLTPTTKKSKHH